MPFKNANLAAIAAVIVLSACSKRAETTTTTTDESATTLGGVSSLAVNTPDPVAALASCDSLASHPHDPGRMKPGVSDDQMAPGAAVPACEAAVQLNPEEPRAHFELGRAYWLAGRDSEAFDSFSIAAGKGHSGAMKFIGDAYVEGRGLPNDIPADPDMRNELALAWYQKSADANYPDGLTAVNELNDVISKNRFDAAGFQNGQAMQAIYTNSYVDKSKAVLLAYYARGVIEQLNADDQFFMDPKCKPLVYKISGLVVDVGVVVAYIKGVDKTEDLIGALLSYAVRDFAIDMGKRDAINLMNRYGCDSRIVSKVVDNIIMTNNSRS